MSIKSRWLILIWGSLLIALARARRLRRALLPREDGSRSRPTFEWLGDAATAGRVVPPLLPCRREREQILFDLVPHSSSNPDLDLPLLARLTSGFDPQTLQRLVSRLCADADAEGRTPTMSDAARALEWLSTQEGCRPRLLEPVERRRAAHLVAGHATIAWTCGLFNHGTTVSILDLDPVGTLIEPASHMTEGGLATRGGPLAALDTVIAGPIADGLLSEKPEWELDETMLRAVELASRVSSNEHVGSRPSLPGFALTNGRGGPPAWFRERPVAPPHVAEPDHEVRNLLEQRRQIVRETLRASTPQLRRLVTLLVEEESVDEKTLAKLFEQG